MKSFLFVLAVGFSAPAFATPTLICSSDDGSQIHGHYSDSEGLTNVRIKTRSGKLHAVPSAHTALIDLDQKFEKVRSLIITDSNGNIQIAVASNRYVNRAGTSSISECEVRY